METEGCEISIGMENLAISDKPNSFAGSTDEKPNIVDLNVAGPSHEKLAEESGAPKEELTNKRNGKWNRKPRGPRNGPQQAGGNKGTPRSNTRKEKPGNDQERAVNWWKAPWKGRIFTSGEYEGDWEKLRMGSRQSDAKGFPAPERLPPRRPEAKRDFRVVGFNRNTTEKEIYDTLLERGISHVNYVRKLLDERGSWWSAARVSITQKDVEVFLKPDFWEPWICVVPWVWQGQRGPNGEFEEGGLNDEYDEY